MAESTPDLRGLPRDEAYPRLEELLTALLPDGTDEIARMATFACVVHHGLGTLWTGFYRRTRPGLLEVGPYQGTLGCMEIRFGQGVCGTAAARGQTVIVPDVNAFEGHIACDARSRSEIVVPVFDVNGEVAAVLDLDSDELAAFGEVDARWLERLVKRFVQTR